MLASGNYEIWTLSRTGWQGARFSLAMRPIQVSNHSVCAHLTVLNKLLVLPHQASGAMSAIEDAEALSMYLREVTPTSNPKAVNHALQHAFRVRYKRASFCQTRSRAMGLLAWDKNNKQSSDELFELWMYPGAAQWEVARPDMILPE